MEGQAYVQSLREQMKERYPDAPPFLQALYKGELSKEDLRLWVKDLYTYWDNTIVYSTGAIFNKNNDEPLRTHILRRMVDIEGEVTVQDLAGSTTPAYEELWLRFGEGLGLSREEITSAQPFSRTHFAMSTLRTFARYWDWTWLDGIAVFYAEDLHWQAYFPKAAEALKNHYSLDGSVLEFFDVVAGDAASHIPWEEEALAYWACTTERQLTAARAFRERLDIENQLQVAVEQARTEGKMPLQVPA
ncbi:MAG: hypothetical protein WD533_02295 [Dehalococcoidia bacterium]